MPNPDPTDKDIFPVTELITPDALDDFTADDILQSPRFKTNDVRTVEALDSGQALQALLDQYIARIRQLKEGLSSTQKENDHMIDEYLLQNLELINLNKNLEYKVKERTRELEITNVKLEVTNQNFETANRLLEEQAQQLKELDQTKEALIHMIVHDMKNPLTAILGTLTLFQKNDYNLQGDIHDLLKHSHGHGIKLLSMIEEFLMIGRMKTKEFKLKPEHSNVIDILNSSLGMMRQSAAEKDLPFVFQADEAELMLDLDSQLIERVINNLLGNAIKYSPKGKEITLKVERLEKLVQISITNLGPTIPHEYHQKIFELFSRVNKEDKQCSGTGLGLSFSKLAVEAHGGTLEVISPVLPYDEGACFCFTLPLILSD